MTQGVQTKLDGDTLVVRIPLRFQRRGGRKRIVAPDGSELAPAPEPQANSALIKAFARAWRWQTLMDAGIYTSVTEIAEAEGISKSFVSRISRLTLVAPDIVEAIVTGKERGIMLEQLEEPFPADWGQQRNRFFQARSQTQSPR